MIKYPSIEQFRQVIREVKSRHDFKGKDELGNAIYSHSSDYPTLTFKGTVKLHGTNAGIVKYKDRIAFQSRERELTLTSDNAGFMLTMSNLNLDFLFEHIEFNESIAVYGEWCGGNIQKGVAITGMPKMFVIFGYLVDGFWREIIRANNCKGIYHIDQFPTFSIDIDFNTPESSQNKLIELTISVEQECPVGKSLGVSGIGEGIVFTCVSDPNLKFKSKGEKHSSSKVKILNSVNTEEIESINEFVDYAVTENRLKQGIENLKSNGINLHSKNTGDFIKWIIADIVKEETDTIIKNQIDIKKANGKIAFKAKNWFFNNI